MIIGEIAEWDLRRNSAGAAVPVMKKRVFTVKTKALSRKKLGRREYLNDADTKGLMASLNRFFESTVEIPRIRVGGKQTIETLINE
jgi:hypothetical protein